jgi:hypothetical protein
MKVNQMGETSTCMAKKRNLYKLWSQLIKGREEDNTEMDFRFGVSL